MKDDIVEIVLNMHYFTQDLTKQNILYHEEIERLHSIIKEVRKKLKKHENDREANRYAPIIECLEILDRENK